MGTKEGFFLLDALFFAFPSSAFLLQLEDEENSKQNGLNVKMIHVIFLGAFFVLMTFIFDTFIGLPLGCS